ncbi:MAG: hypothetical protein HYW65_04570 [Candidatus Liptonbacteria bacterium]|nr:hypothetical protein [Candidatus Liptonbacteria bacterium]
MKKITLCLVILVLGLGLQGGMVRAETVGTNVRALDVAEAAAMQEQLTMLKAAVADLEAQVVLRRVLQQTLDVLNVLVREVKDKLENPNLAAREKTMIGGGLAGVSRQLLSLRDTLSAPASPKPIARARPLPQVKMEPVVAEQPEVMKQSEELAAVAVSEPSKSAEAAVIPKEASKEAQTASLSEKGGWSTPLAVVLVLLGIGAFLWWRGREKKEVQVLPAVPTENPPH